MNILCFRGVGVRLNQKLANGANMLFVWETQNEICGAGMRRANGKWRFTSNLGGELMENGDSPLIWE